MKEILLTTAALLSWLFLGAIFGLSWSAVEREAAASLRWVAALQVLVAFALPVRGLPLQLESGLRSVLCTIGGVGVVCCATAQGLGVGNVVLTILAAGGLGTALQLALRHKLGWPARVARGTRPQPQVD